MNHAVPVGVIKGASHLRKDGLDDIRRQALFLSHDGFEGSPLDELHHEVGEILGLSYRIDGDDAGV